MSKTLVFDFETTGLSVLEDRIVEAGYIVFDEDWKAIDTPSWRIKPGIMIGEKAESIHGISNEDVADCPSFAEVGEQFAMDLHGVFEGGGTVCGYNARGYDAKMMNNELTRAGLDSLRFNPDNVLDPLLWLRAKTPRIGSKTLSNMYKFWCGPVPEGTHSAIVDCGMTGRVLRRLIADEIIPEDRDVALAEQLVITGPTSLDEDKYGRWVLMVDDKNKAQIKCGKYAGILVSEVPKDYLLWVLDNANGVTKDARRVLSSYAGSA